MRDPLTAMSGWLKGLLGGAADGSPRYPGTATRRTGGAAVQATESSMAEALVGIVAAPFEIEPGNNVFGRPALQSTSDREFGCIATASGFALTGMRAAAFLPADRLPHVLEPLRAAVARRTPLVVQVTASERGHGGYHAVAGSGAFMLLARDAQHAVDLAVAARFIAERSLTPGIVAIDGPETAADEADVLMPDPELIRAFVGDPGDAIDCPTPSQRLLFGETRRTVPRWFDPDRPTALGVLPTGAEFDAAVAGRRAFFADHVAGIAARALDALGRLTGRELPLTTAYGLDRARHVIVTQGAAAVTAARVAEGRSRAGVLGLVWNRPFPADDVREALRGVESITVLERVDESETDRPPLLRDVEAAVRGLGFPVLSATFDRLSEAQAEAVFRNMEAGSDARVSVRLGVAPPPATSDYPRRQVMLQAIRREYPGLGDRTVPIEVDSLERPSDGAGGTAAIPAPAELPWVVRQFEHTASTYDSVPRFWGEFTEPRREGGEHSVPDPYLALGAVPACTATFHDRARERERAPLVDPEKCTACGKCWTWCPDSSIAPVALGTAALLEAAHEQVVGDDASDPAAGKLQRAYKQLASRIDGRLAKSEATTLNADALDDAYRWLIEKTDPPEDERAVMDRVFSAVRDAVAVLPLSVTAPLFRAPHEHEKGSGSLLLLAINPRTCQGCGVCGAVCPDEAIEITPQDAESVAAMRTSWSAWERLPDTPGSAIAKAAEDGSIGKLPSILMSRHCLFSVTGADGAEKGSGERLAGRHVAAVTEFAMQRRVVGYARDLEDLARRLRDAVRETLASALPADDLERLERTIESVPVASGRTASLRDVIASLESTGEHAGVDAARVHDLARAARRVEQAHWRALAGLQGVGRARYGVVVAGRDTARWAAMFPRNPFSVPLVVDLAGEGPDLAIGVVEGMLAELVDELREVRRARLLLDPPSDLPARLREADAMTWRDLTPEELETCPPVLVLAGSDALHAAQVAGLSRLLSSGLPIKLVVLDGRDLRDRGYDPTLLALAHREAFVLSTSPAYPDHLFAGVDRAVRSTGPALIHVHAPSPSRDGFETDRMVERARLAVETRVHPLVCYDPAGEGAFGLRLSLDGNPAVGETWARDENGSELTPEVWMAGETRYAGLDPETIERIVGERRDHWHTLQELAGVVTPFTQRVREQAEHEVADAHRDELEALKQEHERRIAELAASQDADQAARLKARLMQLAGYGAAPRGAGGGDGESP